MFFLVTYAYPPYLSYLLSSLSLLPSQFIHYAYVSISAFLLYLFLLLTSFPLLSFPISPFLLTSLLLISLLRCVFTPYLSLSLFFIPPNITVSLARVTVLVLL